MKTETSSHQPESRFNLPPLGFRINTDDQIPSKKIPENIQKKMDELMHLAEPHLQSIVKELITHGLSVSEFALTTLPPNLVDVKKIYTPSPELVAIIEAILEEAYPTVEKNVYTKNFAVAVKIGDVLMEARRRDKDSLIRELGQLIKMLSQ